MEKFIDNDSSTVSFTKSYRFALLFSFIDQCPAYCVVHHCLLIHKRNRKKSRFAERVLAKGRTNWPVTKNRTTYRAHDNRNLT